VVVCAKELGRKTHLRCVKQISFGLPKPPTASTNASLPWRWGRHDLCNHEPDPRWQLNPTKIAEKKAELVAAGIILACEHCEKLL